MRLVGRGYARASVYGASVSCIPAGKWRFFQEFLSSLVPDVVFPKISLLDIKDIMQIFYFYLL